LNPRPPFWRGTRLKPERSNEFWKLPATPQEFQEICRQHLRAFYKALEPLQVFYAQQKSQEKRIRVEVIAFNPESPISAGRVTNGNWVDAIDTNCRIVICTGQPDNCKAYALATLHSPDLKISDEDKSGKEIKKYDGNLCGQNSRPSPVWITDLEAYQVVTIFGVNQEAENSRNKYLDALGNHAQVWPLLA
jgi:CRISPR-associated protein Cmr6